MGETYKYTYNFIYRYTYKYTYRYMYNYVYRYMYTIGKTNAGKAQLPAVYIMAVGRVETRIRLDMGGILRLDWVLWGFIGFCKVLWGASHFSTINQILLYIYLYIYLYVYLYVYYMYTYIYIIAHPLIKSQIFTAVKFCGQIKRKTPTLLSGSLLLRIKSLRNPLPYPCPLPKAQTELPFPELQEF